MAIQRVSSKWAKTKVLLRNQQVSPYVPITRKYARDTLIEMLESNPLVYIKPDKGTYGIGVMNVERREDTVTSDHDEAPVVTISYTFRYGTRSEKYSRIDELHRAVLKHTKGHFYLIQQGIVTLKYQDRQFDLRILTQKTPYGTWETTGIIARVAAENKIITNYHSGGSVRLLNEVLEGHLEPLEAALLEKKLHALGEQTAKQLQNRYPHLKEIGLDVALDAQMHPWILEVNTLPAIFPFKKFFKDKSVYRRIERYAISYGRLSGSRRKSH